MTRNEQRLLLTLSYSTMILVAVCYSLRSFLIPDFKTTFHMDNTQMGLIISFSQLASMLFSYAGGKYCLRWGQKRIVALGCFLSALFCILMGFSTSMGMMAVAYIGISCGVALLILGLNTVLPLILFSSQTVLMNLLHFFFGLGTTVSQQFLSFFLENGGNWRILFFFTAAPLILAGVYMMLGQSGKTGEFKSSHWHLPHPIFTRYLIFALSLYIIGESLLGNWVINFLSEGYHLSPQKAGLYSTLFFGTFTFGRLIGGFIMNPKDLLFSIGTCTTLAAFSITLGLWFGAPALFLIGISGIFFAAVYPTTVTLSNRIFQDAGPYFLGISSIATGVGIFVFNTIFGFLNDRWGVHATFYLIPCVMMLSTVCYGFCRQNLPPALDKESLP